jgi:hypothetical protein
VPKLFPGNREWWARNASGQKINASKIGAIHVADGGFDYLPMRAVTAERIASVMVNLDSGGDIEASVF